jgi:molybdopterin/thiamine biosynthesis adenylyltransferase
VERPIVLRREQKERYRRHLALPEIGERGQVRLLKGKVLILGAGGLGSPAAMYLAAAGVGTLGIVDDDVVELSNLQRQIIHSQSNTGKAKVESARQTLQGLNSDVDILTFHTRITASNVSEILSDFDVIVDGSDNFSTRYLLNGACVQLRKPIIHGSIYRFEGHITTIMPHQGPCYRCLFPAAPGADIAPSCAEAGVLGVLPGLIGVLQATEAIKILLEKGSLLVGRLLAYHALEARFRELTFQRDEECTACGDSPHIELNDMAPQCSVVA